MNVYILLYIKYDTYRHYAILRTFESTKLMHELLIKYYRYIETYNIISNKYLRIIHCPNIFFLFFS